MQAGGDPAEDFETAAREYTAALDVLPTATDIRIGRSTTFRMRGRLAQDNGDDPMDWYRKALEDATLAASQRDTFALEQRASTLRMMAIAVARRGEDPRPLLKEAETDLEEVLQRSPRSMGALYERGNLYATLGDLAREGGDPVSAYEHAAADLKQVLNLDHREADCFTDLGRIEARLALTLHQRGQDAQPHLEEAMAYLEKAMQLAPNDPGVSAAFGEAIYIQSYVLETSRKAGSKHAALARHWFSRALASRAGYVQAYAGRALSRVHLETPTHVEDRELAYEEAFADLEKALTRSPGSPAFLLTRAWVHIIALMDQIGERQEHADKAMQDLDQVLLATPQDAYAWFTRAVLRVRVADSRIDAGKDATDELRLALTDLDEALIWNPDDPLPYLERALLRLQLAFTAWQEDRELTRSHLEAARIDCEQGLQRNPASDLLKEIRCIALVELAGLSAGTGDANKALCTDALIALKGRITDNPGDRELHNALGVLHEGLGNTKEALAAYEAELDLAPEDPDLRIRINELQVRLDKEAP